MLALIIIGSAFGGVTALKLPPTYTSSSVLLVEGPQIPDNLVAPTVLTEASEQLEVIQQRLMTRANLIDIANELKVFRGEGPYSPDEIVQKMKESTTIRRQSGRGRATLMTIRFNSADPKTAANVVNEFVTLVLEVNNEFRITRAENTLEFFEQEVQRLSVDIDRKSADIVEFRNLNAEALPESLDYRLGRQTLLQERQARLDRDRSVSTTQREEIIRLFESTGVVRNSPQQQALSPDEAQLAQLNAELDQLLSVFSDTNPKVKILKGRIENLEDRIALSVSSSNGSTDEEPDEENTRNAMLQISLGEVDARLGLIDQEYQTITEELEKLEESIRATSANAIALATLERDYDSLQARYKNAVDNLNRASIGERIEVTSQGQRITVIESASVPSEPSGPERMKIAIMGVGAGIGAAGAFFLILELLNRTIRRPVELTSRFQITPIATLPYMESRGERRLRRAALVAACLVVLAGVPAGLWYVDTYFMPLDLLASRIISRLGLT
jgi:uncharacterized protein involved in exopolysaccharide biosynthesis